MSVIFRNESRRDLAEAIRTDYTCDYLFPKVFPAINVYETAGQIAVATKEGVTADTSRAYNEDLTVNHYGNTAVNFSTVSYEARVGVTDEDLKLKGDDLNIIQPELANAAAEAAVGEMEVAAASALYDAVSGNAVTLTTTAPLAGIAEAAYKVAPYGQPTLVCSQKFLTKLISQPAFNEPILKLFGEGVITGLIGGAEAVMQSVGGWMGLPGGILVGKDTYWKDSATESDTELPGFVVALRPEMRDPARAYWTAKAKASFGATLTFLPRDTEGTPWFVDTVYLPGSKLNCVDVGIKAVPKVFNKDAAVAINFSD